MSTSSTSSVTSSLWALIPAAGVGARMGAEIPKQYLPLCGKTILEQTLNKLSQLHELEGIVVVVDKDDERWSAIDTGMFRNLHATYGGATRAESVLKGLQFIQQHTETQHNVQVLVHDAARPCVRVENIRALVEACDHAGCGGILAAPVADTVKRSALNEGVTRVSTTVDRAALWLAHTPQYFPLGSLLEALELCERRGLSVTDEASAVENSGEPVLLIEDGNDNIKITLPQDLIVAEAVLANQLAL